MAEGRARPGGKKRQGWGESVGGERGGHPLFPPMGLVEGGDGRPLLRWRGRPVGGKTGAGDEHPLLVLGEGWRYRRRTEGA